MTYTASVVVPVFNTEAYLPACLQSLLDQTHRKFEIVIVDDASPGNCRALVEDFQSRRGAIKYVRHSTNFGLLRARFTGAEHSTGDYVGYVDSDDIACPNFVETLLTVANESGADIIGGLQEGYKGSHLVLDGGEPLLMAMANRTVNYAVYTKLYRRGLLLSLEDLRELAERDRLDVPEDLILNVFCALRAKTYVGVPEVLVDYNRTRTDSLSNDMTLETILQNIESRIKVYDTISEVGKECREPVDILITRSAASFFKRTLARCGPKRLRQVTAHLAESPNGAKFAALVLEAAENDRRSLAERLERLVLQRERLLVERQERQINAKKLKQKLNDERKRRKKISNRLQMLRKQHQALVQKLEWIGSFKIVRFCYRLVSPHGAIRRT
jgi:glycosyltransferase involved in cell wall biosynthesis